MDDDRNSVPGGDQGGFGRRADAAVKEPSPAMDMDEEMVLVLRRDVRRIDPIDRDAVDAGLAHRDVELGSRLSLRSWRPPRRGARSALSNEEFGRGFAVQELRAGAWARRREDHAAQRSRWLEAEACAARWPRLVPCPDVSCADVSCARSRRRQAQAHAERKVSSASRTSPRPAGSQAAMNAGSSQPRAAPEGRGRRH